MTQVIVADLITGRRILSLPVSALSWARPRNAAETIRCTVPMRSRAIRKLDLPNATTPAKSMLAVIENDTVMAAGPIWSRRFDDDTWDLQLNAAGLWSYFDHRQIIPLLTDAQNVIDPATGGTAVWAGTDFTLATWGLIAKRLVQQSMLWTGGNLPIVFQADEAGTVEQHYKGSDLTSLGQGLTNIINRVDGVDIDFRPQRTPDRLGIQWQLLTGTAAVPQLHSGTVHRFDRSVPKPSTKSLTISDDASSMTGQAWTVGGRSDGTAVVSRAVNHGLTNVGYPLLESVDSSHNDTSEPSTLMAYSQNAILLGSAPGNTWAFSARGDRNPRIGSYWPGDFCDVIMPRDHPWVPRVSISGAHRREIATIGGDQDGRWFDIGTQETINA